MADEQQSLFDEFLADCQITKVDRAKSTKISAKPDYEIRRSKRRKKSVGAFRENGKTIMQCAVIINE